MRKAKPKKRYLLPDPKYKDTMVTRFVDYMMNEGKKSAAYSMFYEAIDRAGEKSGGESGIEVWRRAVSNVVPSVEVKSRRVGGATFQIPIEVRPERKTSLAIKWLIQYARARGEKTMADRLAAELLAASKGEGASVKKKDDTHRMAEANKAFSHFRL